LKLEVQYPLLGVVKEKVGPAAKRSPAGLRAASRQVQRGRAAAAACWALPPPPHRTARDLRRRHRRSATSRGACAAPPPVRGGRSLAAAFARLMRLAAVPDAEDPSSGMQMGALVSRESGWREKATAGASRCGARS